MPMNRSELKDVLISFLKNWKTTAIAFVLLGFAWMRFAGKISTEELVSIITALSALGFTLAKDSNKQS